MARKLESLETFDAGADVLLVRGLVDGKKVEARGWLSALANHYGPEAYDEKGERKMDAKREQLAHQARAMTTAERRAYCERLLEAAAPAPSSAPQKLELF